MNIQDPENMPLRDRLYMSSINRYKVYGLFPWAMIISVILACCTSFQVILVISTSTNYSYKQMQLWNELFLNRDVEGQDSDLVNSFHIFNTNKLKEYIHETVNKYVHIDKYTIDEYEHDDKHNGQPVIRMYINYLDRSKAFDKDLKTKYILTESDLGPFDHYSPKTFIELVESFTLEFSLKHKLNHNVPTASSCYTWTIYQMYNYEMHGPITVSLDFNRGICNQGFFKFSSKYYGLNLITLGLAITQLTLTVLQIYRRTALMGNIKSVRASAAVSVWDSLDFGEKLKFIDTWVIFTSLGNICQILGCLCVLIIDNIALEVNETVIGLGCFCSWISVIQHLQHSHNTYLVIDTLSRSFNRLGPYVLGVVPIFMGFVFLAICLFWKTGSYPNVTQSLMISYCMVNGDSLYQYMSLNIQAAGVYGELYCYAFLLFFICVVQNIFIAIIVDGFQSLMEIPADKTGENEYEQTVNISLQTLGDEDKMLSRQKSKLAFKKILDSSKPRGEDKTQKYVEKLEGYYLKIVKSLDKLVDIKNTKDKEIDVDKLSKIINDFLKNEVHELAEAAVSY